MVFCPGGGEGSAAKICSGGGGVLDILCPGPGGGGVFAPVAKMFVINNTV